MSSLHQGSICPVTAPWRLCRQQGIFYISGTDYDRAWKGQVQEGREKLFCYDYVSNSTTLTQLWEYQFLGPEWYPPRHPEHNPEYIVKGHDPYQVAGYSLEFTGSC